MTQTVIRHRFFSRGCGLLAVAIVSLSTPVSADEFALSLTDDSAKAQLTTLNHNDELAFGVGYTYHTGARHIANLDFHAQGRTAIGNLPATAGVGMRAMYFYDSPLEGGGVGLGGYTRLNIPQVPGLSVGGSLHYSPTVLSYGDSDGMWNFESTVNYRVIRNAEFFIGYRYVATELEERSRDLRLEEGFLAGLRMYF